MTKLYCLSAYTSRGGSRDFEKDGGGVRGGGVLCRSPWLADEENFRSQMV